MRKNKKKNIEILLFRTVHVVKVYICCANLHFLKVKLNEKNGEKCYSMSIRNQGGKENGKMEMHSLRLHSRRPYDT